MLVIHVWETGWIVLRIGNLYDSIHEDGRGFWPSQTNLMCEVVATGCGSCCSRSRLEKVIQEADMR